MANNKNNPDSYQENEKEFPGYPHYPAREDILNQPDAERVDVDVENLSRSNNQTSSALPNRSDTDDTAISGSDEDIATEPNDANVTADDLIALEETDADTAKVDTLEGEDDLDIPGAEEDDANEKIGEEDEENNYYSLGGDAHDDLEEDKG